MLNQITIQTIKVHEIASIKKKTRNNNNKEKQKNNYKDNVRYIVPIQHVSI